MATTAIDATGSATATRLPSVRAAPRGRPQLTLVINRRATGVTRELGDEARRALRRWGASVDVLTTESAAEGREAAESGGQRTVWDTGCARRRRTSGHGHADRLELPQRAAARVHVHAHARAGEAPVSRESGPSVAALVPCHVRPPDPALLDELAGYVSRILVVGDGVPLEVFSAVAGRRDICVLALPRHVGKGSAVAAGLDVLLRDEPVPDAVVVVDADGQHPPAAIPRFVAAAEAGAELVIGDRFGDPAAMPPHRRIANRLTSRLVAAVAGRPVGDTQCGMRLLTGRALHDVRFPRGAYEAETRHLRRCLAAGVAVSWVPIPAIYKGELSSFRAVRDGIRVLRAAVGP